MHHPPRLLGQPRYQYQQLGSTNQRAGELLSAGAIEGTTVIAETQTQGRGQRGHIWESGRGGIYLSVILRPQLKVEYLLQITFWSAWGICWALRRQGIPVQLKWPNDLVIGERKLGGLLTEARIQGDRLVGAVVGVGLNGCNQVPNSAVTLAKYQAFDYEQTCLTLLQGLEVGYLIWQRRGFERIATYYQRWWINRGQVTPQGLVQGIDSWGRVQVGDAWFYPGQVQLGYGSNHRALQLEQDAAEGERQYTGKD
jgi:BirA family biotin operon repressor/biotin-[acetyl-CoA-carboxylase] ligase